MSTVFRFAFAAVFCLFAVALAKPTNEKNLRQGPPPQQQCFTIMVMECTFEHEIPACAPVEEEFCWYEFSKRAIPEIHDLFTSRRKVESAKRDEEQCRTVYQKVCTSGQKGHECDMVPTTVCFSRVD